MLLNTRPTTVLDVIPPTGPNRISTISPPEKTTLFPGPPTGSFHYNGVPPPSKFSWLAIIVSVGFHSVVLLGFNNHTHVKKVVQKEEVVEQMLMMPDLKDDEEEKPRSSMTKRSWRRQRQRADARGHPDLGPGQFHLCAAA